MVASVAVPRGEGPVHPLPPAPRPELAELDAVRAVLDGVETDGLVVLHDGALVLEDDYDSEYRYEDLIG